LHLFKRETVAIEVEDLPVAVLETYSVSSTAANKSDHEAIDDALELHPSLGATRITMLANAL